MELIILLLPLAVLLVMAFAIKDIFTRPMEQTHQILWLIVILAFNFLGVCVYYFAKALGAHRDPRTTYRERYEKKFDEVAGVGTGEKEEQKKTKFSMTNLVLIIIAVYVTFILLVKGWMTIRI